MSNTNGNMGLFLVSVFTAMSPAYKLYSGSWITIPFAYVLAFYGVLFFMEHSDRDQRI